MEKEEKEKLHESVVTEGSTEMSSGYLPGQSTVRGRRRYRWAAVYMAEQGGRPLAGRGGRSKGRYPPGSRYNVRDRGD